MAGRRGILLDEETGDLLIRATRGIDGKITGGLVVGPSAAQDVGIVLMAAKGEIKENPVLGVGAVNWVNSTNKDRQLKREVSIQMALIGLGDAQVEVRNGEIDVTIN